MRLRAAIGLPERGRLRRDAAGAARRLAELRRLLRPAAGPADWRRLLRPAGRPRAAVAVALAAAGLWCLLSALAGARAQGIAPGLFAVEDPDTRDLLSFLGDLAAGESAALGSMLFAFNGGVLVLASFLLLWEVVAGTVDTAREGRWRPGGWHIVRIVAAVALMVPLPGAGGLNGIQHAVLGLAHLGGDFAAAVWRPFADEVLERGAPLVPRPHEGRRRAAIGRVLVAEVCAEAANGAAANAGAAAWIEVAAEEITTGGLFGALGDTTALHIGYDGTNNTLGPGLCGAVRYADLDAEGAPGIAARAHRDALETVRGDLRGLAGRLADRFVPGRPDFGEALPDIAAALDALGVADRYAAVLDAGMAAAETERQAALSRVIADEAAATGWLGAATFFSTVARNNGRFSAAAAGVADVSLPRLELEERIPEAHAAATATIAALGEAPAWRPGVLAGDVDPAGHPVGAGGSFEALLGGVFSWIGLDASIVADSGNPLADLAALGHFLVEAALSGITLLGAAATGSGLLESVPLIGRGLDFFESSWNVFDSFISLALGVLLVSGLVLAWLLPILPFIRFLFGILSWLLAIAEALLAVTVWAAAHIVRDDPGRAVTQATRQGWLFLPALILRPVLMLFGLLLGHVVFVAAMGLLNLSWAPALRDVTASGATGPVGYLALLVLYVMIAWGLAAAAFKLIDILPDRVLTWIGSQAGTSGDGADRVGGAATGGMGRLETMRLGHVRGGGRRHTS